MTDPIRKLTDIANTISEARDVKPKDIKAVRLSSQPGRKKQITNANMMTANDVQEKAHELDEAKQQVIGKYRFTPFTEGSISGWTISVQNIGEVGYIEAPAKKNTDTSVAPYKVYRSKGSSTAWERKLVAYPGTETKIISEKEIRYAPRQLLKAVAMWMDKHGTKAMTEEVQGLQENMIKHFTDLGDFAKNVNHNAVLLRKKDRLKTSDVQNYLLQIAGSLNIAHGQQQDFLQGLIFHLEGLHKKVMSPSKHGNMEIMKDLEFMIRELKTYKKR